MSDFDDFEDFDGEISENPDVKNFLAGMFQTDDALAGYSDDDKDLIREFISPPETPHLKVWGGKSIKNIQTLYT